MHNMRVPIDGNYTAQVRLLLPPLLNWDDAKKYPIVVHAYVNRLTWFSGHFKLHWLLYFNCRYGAPKYQQVLDRYTLDWGTYFSSTKGIIYAHIDGRGSGGQGDKILHEIYRRMGTVEIQDQIAVTK